MQNFNFTGFARSVLLMLLKLTKHRVYLCFDMYESLSIKDIKRESLGHEKTEKTFYIWTPSVHPNVTLMNCQKC